MLTNSRFCISLQSLCPNPTTLIGDPSGLFFSPIRATDITWNFEKFLIDYNGNPRKRYTPAFQPLELKKDIQKLMEECKKSKERKVLAQSPFNWKF